ncbi:MAG: Gfo/Idh/MocA family protein [Chitinophagaceae bacterium]
MEPTIRWGILGAGRIARKFASDLRLVEGAELLAVGSRGMGKASKFAAEFGAPLALNSYEELAAHPDIDVVYIATPHNFHLENTLLCLDHHKGVLCEKPFAINSREVQEMIHKAREKKVFLMEALWTKFMPHYQRLKELLAGHYIGEIKTLLVNFGFIPVPPIPQRLLDPALGGGTILDIGIYNVFLALSVLGQPEHIWAVMSPASTGVDEQCAVLMGYENGAMAQLFSSFASNLDTAAEISGTKGRIKLTHRFYEPSATIQYFPSGPSSEQIIPVTREPGFGYQYEARHVGDCLRKGLLESPVMSHADSLQLIHTLDEIRQKAGIRYAADL